ncbi:PD-(D/E)XK nuclease family protein [Haloarcula sediminis]|uniref:hypothetical protein n=1 Tax=Haloarcula sediminis TaxID=3111777 RepID=UPI002D77EAD6|nr:hypothetical protein [Haloarcula sp. CK38]
MGEQTTSQRPHQTTHGVGNVYIDEQGELLRLATRAEHATTIVLAPTQLHKRNLKVALAAEGRPRSSLSLRAPSDVAADIVQTRTGTAPSVLDKLDRRRAQQAILRDDPDSYAELQPVFGTDLHAAVEQIEVARQELRLMTGFETARLDAVASVADDLSPVAREDTHALLSGLQTLDTELRARTDGVVSDGALLDTATAALRETDGGAWERTYPRIERLAVGGISTLGTPLLGFLDALTTTTDVDVTLFLRAGTGPGIRSRLDRRVGVQRSGDDPSPVSRHQRKALSPGCPVTEIPAATKHEECRAVAALVDSILDSGHTATDIALVARDADEYERPLSRAMSVYGRHLSVWSQLELKRTLPYRLVVAVCTALGDESLDSRQLLRPLALQWTPPFGAIEAPLSAAALSVLRRRFDTTDPQSPEGWLKTVAADGTLADQSRAHVVAFLNWCRDQPAAPGPDDVVTVLEPIVDAFDRNVLPERVADDDQSYSDASRTARAVERVAGEAGTEHLLRETRAKYADWLERGHIGRSWAEVSAVLDAIATVRPGRREHGNAERIDVLDATDTWLRSYPYVVALGLVDGTWPQRPHGAFPSTFRTAVVDGHSQPARQLGVRGAWTEAREYDHFADAVHTAAEHLVVTRYREDVEGVQYQRSPLLDTVDPTPLSADAQQRLRSVQGAVPAPLSGVTAATNANAGERR